jgi:hypothetical protein
MARMHLKTLYRLPLVLGVLLAFLFLPSGPAQVEQAPSAKQPQSPELAASSRDADVAVGVEPAPPLPDKIPAIPLPEGPIHPSPLTGGVRHLPYVPPSPDTKPEFELAPGAAKIGNQTPAPAAPSLVLAPMPAPLKSFDGLDFNNNGAGHPPDTNGDVGSTYYMQAVNTSIGIFNKQTGALQAAFTFNSFWSGAGTGTACDTTNQGDVVVLYDTQNEHWIFMDFAWTDLQNGPYYFCYGVSQTSDPLGSYWRYAIRADDASHPWLPDYPKGGVWPDGLYFSSNMFDCLNSSCSLATYKEARAYALNLQKMEAGQTLMANDVQAVDTSASYFTLMPSNARRSQPPANTPNYFVSEDLSNFDWDVFKFHVDFSNPANSSLTGPTQVSQTSYTTAASTVAEPSPGNNIDTLADRMMFLNQYRRINNSESLWVQHTVGTASASTPTGIQWAQIDVSAGTVHTTPVQQQIFNNGADGLNRFMGSMAVDQNGDAALGYSISSASLAPDIRYVGRLASDPLGQMPRSETSLLGGATRSVQTGTCGGSTCTRWGDYSAMTVDPLDDCTFWYTNMYFPVQGANWVTRIGSFKFPTCVNASTTSLVSHPNPSIVGQTVTLTATVSSGLTGLGAPSGVVSFTIGSGLPAAVILSNGIATLMTNSLPAGTYPITATYGGDANFGPSQAVLVPEQTVNKAASTTSLVSHPNPSIVGQMFTLTATVSSSLTSLGAPSGVVSITIGSGLPVAVNLSNGIATLMTNTLPVGTYPITATYGGDANFSPSQAVLAPAQTVNKAASTTSLVSKPNPSIFGQTVTFTATVGSSASGLGAPSGVVSFTIGGGLPAAVTLSNGIATLMTNTLPVGTYPITATYGGDANFGPSQDVLVPRQTVKKAGTNTALALLPLPASLNARLALTATVTTVAPGSGTPTGVVTFTIDGAMAGAPALSATGVVTLTTTPLALATHRVEAIYNGDASFNGSRAHADVNLSSFKLFMPFLER